MSTIINLTGRSIAMYAMADVVASGRNGGYYLRGNAEPVAVFPSQGVARATCADKTVGSLEGLDLVEREYGPPRGLPAPQDGIYYIVSALVANAARQHGRTIHDLLLTSRQVRDMQDRVVGYAAFAWL